MSIELAKHVFAPGEGEVLQQHGPVAGNITILVDPLNTGETSLCSLIQTLDPSAAVPVHHHALAEQVIFFLSGRGKASLDGNGIDAIPGTTIHIPKGVKHGIENTGEEPLSFLETTSPPGFEKTFRTLAQIANPTPEDIGQIAAEHDILVDPVKD